MCHILCQARRYPELALAAVSAIILVIAQLDTPQATTSTSRSAHPTFTAPATSPAPPIPPAPQPTTDHIPPPEDSRITRAPTSGPPELTHPSWEDAIETKWLSARGWRMIGNRIRKFFWREDLPSPEACGEGVYEDNLPKTQRTAGSMRPDQEEEYERVFFEGVDELFTEDSAVMSRAGAREPMFETDDHRDPGTGESRQQPIPLATPRDLDCVLPTTTCPLKPAFGTVAETAEQHHVLAANTRG